MGHFRQLKPILLWTTWGLLLAGLQTTVWPLLVGGVPAPQLWLNFILFFILFRPVMRALLITYALGLLFAPFTSLSLGIYWASFLILVPVGSSIKSRAFWPGVPYFMMGSLLLAFGWHAVSFGISQFTETNAANLHPFTRLTEILLTPLAAYPQYFIMQWIDRIDQDDIAATSFSGVEE